jgi:hypothetical protein
MVFIDELMSFCISEEAQYPDCIICTHPSEACSGGCQACLDHVHFFKPDAGKRVDYDCEKLLFCYVQKYGQRYKNNICTALQNIDLDKYSFFNILSIGCGAAPDLMAIEEIVNEKTVFYEGYDKNIRWKRIHNFIECYSKNTVNITTIFRQEDIFDVFAKNKLEQNSYNVVVIQYLISHLFNTGQNDRINELYTGLINNVVSCWDSQTPFLIIINDIDTIHKGRNFFCMLLDVLEDNDYSGKATAYSAHPDGDLGETRWGGKKNRSGNIEYTYKTQPSGFEGAGLLIELRR